MVRNACIKNAYCVVNSFDISAIVAKYVNQIKFGTAVKTRVTCRHPWDRLVSADFNCHRRKVDSEMRGNVKTLHIHFMNQPAGTAAILGYLYSNYHITREHRMILYDSNVFPFDVDFKHIPCWLYSVYVIILNTYSLYILYGCWCILENTIISWFLINFALALAAVLCAM